MTQSLIPRPNRVTRIKWSLKRRGLIGTARLALLKPGRKLVDWVWDRLHGVETGQIVEIDCLAIPSDNQRYGIRYQPTPTGAFRKMIRTLAIPCENFNFIDFGSGKGRALLLASEFPFNSIIGVEFAPELHKGAESNIRSFHGRQRCHEIRSICMDAAHYRLPPGNSVLYFNFPFQEPVMKTVVAMIHDFLGNSAAEIFLVNYEPAPVIARLLGTDRSCAIVAQDRECAIYRFLPKPIATR